MEVGCKRSDERVGVGDGEGRREAVQGTSIGFYSDVSSIAFKSPMGSSGAIISPACELT
jgi:hypothetical protein